MGPATQRIQATDLGGARNRHGCVPGKSIVPYMT